jgi:DNA polymerase I-like protein with 3'-5' exonuclease and polymerase domains
MLDVPDAECDEVGALTRTVLTGAAELSVPLEVHLAFGDNWADAKS